VTRATGIARSTIGRGLAELRAGETPDAERIRRPGGGRKPVSETDASLLDDLRALVEPQTRGDPQSPLLWTCKSLRKLSQSLRDMGHTIGRTLVGELLHNSITACKPTARPARDRIIPIATRNSTTSTTG
jgi:Rhodopirellula transposase DDE domain